ncbi:hypothetical protein D6777_02780 [Candidatus Woesearchaeota archaeon]|nr:MAG: hypothetical protein D6777_02780 [Candidatus Woesearchaeota archaeon]
MQDKVLDIIVKENEITWQSIIMDLIKTEQMNPWDVDISLLTQEYLKRVKELKKTNFFVSGKVLLAAALLVKIKSNKLLEEDISNFDSILFHQPETYDELDDFMEFQERPKFDVPALAIKTPQARKRRISVKDLIGALERALEVNKRRILRQERLWNFEKPEIPEKKVDITVLIKSMYEKIISLFKKKENITYSKLLPEGKIEKRDKILTLYPLLHLATQDKIDLHQEEHFGEIEVSVKSSL